MLLHFFHSLHNAVTQTGSIFSIRTAFTWLPMSYLPAKWRRRNTIKTFFPFAFLSPGTKEVTIRTVRRLITCIPYFCHLPAPFLLSACYTVHRIPSQLLCSSIKQPIYQEYDNPCNDQYCFHPVSSPFTFLSVLANRASMKHLSINALFLFKKS